MKRHRLLYTLLLLCLTVALIGCSSAAPAASSGDAPKADAPKDAVAPAGSEYPVKDINGIVNSGAGGGNDNIARSIAALVGPIINEDIVVTTMTGSAGVVGAEYVLSQPADGYTILFHPEPISTYRVLGTSEICFDDFETLAVYGSTCGVLLTYNDSPYNTYEDVVAAALAAPGTVTIGATGLGGLPDGIMTMMSYVENLQFSPVQFDSDGDGNTALMGEHIDLFVSSAMSAIPLVQAGSVKPLMVFHTERLPQMPDVPCIAEYSSDYDQFMPWGPFFCASLAAGTDQAIVDKLVPAFEQAFQDESFQKYMSDRGITAVGAFGADAEAYTNRMEAVSSYMMFDAKKTDVDPATFGIERVK